MRVSVGLFLLLSVPGLCGCQGVCAAEDLAALQEGCVAAGGDFYGESSTKSRTECEAAAGAAGGAASCEVEREGSCSAVCLQPDRGAEAAVSVEALDAFGAACRSDEDCGDDERLQCLSMVDEMMDNAVSGTPMLAGCDLFSERACWPVEVGTICSSTAECGAGLECRGDQSAADGLSESLPEDFCLPEFGEGAPCCRADAPGGTPLYDTCTPGHACVLDPVEGEPTFEGVCERG